MKTCQQITKIKDVFPNVIFTGGACTILNKKYGLLSPEIATAFDIMYVTMNGQKAISPFLEELTSSDRVTLVTDEGKRIIVNASNLPVGVKGYINLDEDVFAQVLYTILGDNWKSIQKDFEIIFNGEYGKLTPFKMDIESTENGKLDSTTTRSKSDTYTKKNTGDVTNIGKVTSDETNLKDVFGYNSTDPTSTDKVTSNGTNNSNATNTQDLTETNTGSGTGNDTYGATRSNTRTTTRSGNIGNRSNQEILLQDIELLKNKLYTIIKRDLDRVLTLPIYL